MYQNNFIPHFSRNSYSGISISEYELLFQIYFDFYTIKWNSNSCFEVIPGAIPGTKEGLKAYENTSLSSLFINKHKGTWIQEDI